MKKISIIVSVYNEESALRQFYGESKPIFDALPWDYELLFVNDGSSDGSLAILKEFAAQDPKVKLVNFSRNFGHEAASTIPTATDLSAWTRISSIRRSVWPRLLKNSRRAMRSSTWSGRRISRRD